MSFTLLVLGTTTSLLLLILVLASRFGFWQELTETFSYVVRRGPVYAIFAFIAIVLLIACSTSKDGQVKLACDAAKSLAIAATSFCEEHAEVPVCKDVPKAVSTIDLLCALESKKEG